ncbi:MAG: UrcA family protein [Janthinobacterium lividum]
MTRDLRFFNLRIALSTMLVVTALSCTTAWAAEADVETQSISVDLTDIDVFSPDGRAVARERIAVAANRACNAPDVRELVASEQFRTCREEAMSAARNDLDLRIAALRPSNDASAIVASR